MEYISAIFLTDSPFLWPVRTCLMIFIFLGCVAIVLKGLIILQDNKFIRTVTACSDSSSIIGLFGRECNSMLRFLETSSTIINCKSLIINMSKMRDFIDFRHFVQLKWCNSILRFFHYEGLNMLYVLCISQPARMQNKHLRSSA